MSIFDDIGKTIGGIFGGGSSSNSKKSSSSNPLGPVFVKPSETKAKKAALKKGKDVVVVSGTPRKPSFKYIPHGGGGGGRRSSSGLKSASIQKELNKQAEQVRKLEEAKKQAQAQKQKEEARKIQFAINQTKSNRIKVAQERELKKQIKRLTQKMKEVQSRAELERVLSQKKEKERELIMSQRGITTYNKRVALEKAKAQREYALYINNLTKKLQAQVNAGTMSVNKANGILKKQAGIKANQVNKNLNSKISSISVPNALKAPLMTVKAVEPPKGILEKGISKLQNIPSSKSNRDVERQLEGIKELGIGVGLGALSFVKGFVDLPETIATLVKNPSLIEKIPASIKQSGVEMGESLKISPTRTVARVGTELFLTNKGGEVIKKVTGPSKAKLLSKLDDSGVLSKIKLRIIRGKIPKIKLKINNIEKSLEPVDTARNVARVGRDIAKLIPKIISKTKVTKIMKLSEKTIKSFLKDRRVLKELVRKYPKKVRFTFKEIKTIRSYPKLRTAIKRNVFEKFGVKAVRKAGKVVKKGGRRIKGIKVGRNEFKSFKEAEVEFNKLKRIGKFVKRIENKGGVGKIETLPRRPINAKELEYFKVGRKIPKQILKDVKQVSITTFTQKFSARVPVLKRFGNLKKGFWRTVIKEKEFYENSVSFSLYKSGGKPIGTITFRTLSSKPITRFRSLTNALKWGTNKEIVFSKSVGKDFVRSFLLKARGKKISTREFLSKIKVKNNGEFQDIFINTKKIPRYTTKGNIKKQFEESIPASATKGRIRKIKQIGRTKFNKKRGFMEIVRKGKVVKIIKTKSITNPVIIDTSKIDRAVRELNSLKNKVLTKAKLKRVKQFEKLIKSAKKSRSFILDGKKKVFISESKLKQLDKIKLETRALKESLAGKSIPSRLKITKRVEGIRELKKLKRAEQALKKLKRTLVLKKALDVGLKSAIGQSLLLTNKLKKDLKSKTGLINSTDQKSKQIQSNILKSLQKSKSKIGLKSLNALRLEFPILAIPPIPRGIKTRIPRTKPPKIRIPSNKKETSKMKTFAKPVRIFNVVVKKRGKDIVLNDKLTERDALNYMAYELDTQLLRSARLKEVGRAKKARIISAKYKGAFEKRKRKLRQYKIKGKKKVPIRGFIEKKRFALDTPGEKIQLRRIQKRKVKKKRVVKRKKVVHKKTLKRKPVKRKPVRKRKIVKKRKPIRKRRQSKKPKKVRSSKKRR